MCVSMNKHIYRHLIFSPSTTETIFKRHLLSTYKSLKYVSLQLARPSDQYIKQKEIRFTRTTSTKKTLILDLDETLIKAKLSKEKFAVGAI